MECYRVNGRRPVPEAGEVCGRSPLARGWQAAGDRRPSRILTGHACPVGTAFSPRPEGAARPNARKVVRSTAW